MAKRMRWKRIDMIFLCALALLLGAGSYLFYMVHLPQDRLDGALIVAVLQGDKASVIRDLNAGANPNAVSLAAAPLWVHLFRPKMIARHPVLMDAIWLGEDDIVGDLLDHGANVNVRDDFTGWSALMYAAYYGRSSTCKILLAREADVNATDKKGETALTLAKSPTIIHMLQQAGAKE